MDTSLIQSMNIPDKVLAMLSNTLVHNVWDIDSGTTYLGRALRTVGGIYALRPRDGLIDKLLATAGMTDAVPVVIPAVQGESRKPGEELADEATSRHIRNLCFQFLFHRAGARWSVVGWKRTAPRRWRSPA